MSNSITWITESDLGTILTGYTSELYVQAITTNQNDNLKYKLESGNLPQGLSLNYDGTISGQPYYGNTGTFSFVISANSVKESYSSSNQFTLTIEQITSTKYTTIELKPLINKVDRNEYKNFINNVVTFDPKLIYRYTDPNFGVQREIKFTLEYGIQEAYSTDVAGILYQNFYRKQFYFGDIKKIIAVDSLKTPVYELVYVELIDSQINANGNSVDYIFTTSNVTVYPASIENMLKNVREIELENNSIIEVDEDRKPKFISSFYDDPTFIGYIRAVPICYAKPGKGDKIISRIKLNSFDFKKLKFEIDRLTVNSSLDYSRPQYLRFPREYVARDLTVTSTENTPIEVVPQPEPEPPPPITYPNLSAIGSITFSIPIGLTGVNN